MKRAKAFWIPLLAICAWLAAPSRAALQFDVFAGYDGHVREASWFPIIVEVFNDGPSFNAVIETWGGSYDANQVCQVPIELPTNTRKRVVIPTFASGARYNAAWNGRLVDARGKLIPGAERTGLQTKVVAWEGTILGALPRNFGGSPVLPDVQENRKNLKPEVARFTLEQFPDNPIALEGMNVFYLNSEKAPDLKVPQVTALLAWVRGGGHLIVSTEQISDVNGTPWLQQFLPMELTDMRNLKLDDDVINWVRSQPSEGAGDFGPAAGRLRRLAQTGGNNYDVPVDPAFQGAELPVATGRVKDGYTLFLGESFPLAVQAPRGRGKVTLLTFSPEREPFRGWKGRGFFWAKLAGIPPGFFTSVEHPGWGGTSIDGVFGALIDSRQIKKLPVTWLLLLLVVYLVVIGPFDQWWLKKIGKQMLTWITFPSYVVLFSLLIYFIGYKLRAGETEWNELHIVDILPRGEKVDLRGHTYISIYSSVSETYPLQGQKGHATLRGELMDLRAGEREGSKAKVTQQGDTFKAEVYVPVWTSLLWANEWFKTNDTPFVASVVDAGGAYEVEIQNLMDKKLTDVRVVVGEFVFDLEPIGPREKKRVTLATENGTPLRGFVQQNGSYFQKAVDLRRNPVGDTAGGQLEDRPLIGTAASFISYLQEISQNGRGFIAPAGLDLTPQVERGDAVVFAFVRDHSFAEKINEFQPPRFRRDTLLRLTIPVRQKNAI
jgi:hypothetical protein